jgi:glycosyltransferase involved in cell wall biosynthesis
MKISVITASYNSSSTIADTIRSVAGQTYTVFEHLVIDGLSTDDTVKVVEANWHPNLVLSSEPDMGIYDAMNKGLIRATGEIIGFLNSDDFYEDIEVLARVVQAFEAEPCIEACFGDLVYVTKDNRKVVRYWKSRAYTQGAFAHGWCPAHPTFYIRRTALIRLGKFDLTYRLAADAEFMMRYLVRGGINSKYIPRIQVRMRIGGATNYSWLNVVRQNYEILQALKKNSIPYSILSFVIHKVGSRVWQRLTKFRMLKSA